MGWRFVKQPNGLYARFSEIVDNFTDFDLTGKDAEYIAINEYNCGLETAKQKIYLADIEMNPYTRKTEYPLYRWNECLRIIENVHGKNELENTLRIMGITK